MLFRVGKATRTFGRHFLAGTNRPGTGVVSLLRCFSVDIPERANVVVVGGGIIGTSVAYHLSKLGVEDVILFEKDKLTSGTSKSNVCHTTISKISNSCC